VPVYLPVCCTPAAIPPAVNTPTGIDTADLPKGDNMNFESPAGALLASAPTPSPAMPSVAGIAFAPIAYAPACIATSCRFWGTKLWPNLLIHFEYYFVFL
jgi:hypothetical protein